MPVFHADWFTANVHMWERHVLPRLQQHPVRFLEVGSFEGRSACWLLQNALTDLADRITCIDPFTQHEGFVEYETTFDHNVREIGAGARVEKIKGYSREILRTLPLASYDGCYIDGSHAARDVLRDAVLCFDLVRVGGFIVFDDYKLAPAEDQVVAEAVDAFLAAYSADLKLVFKGWQVMVDRVR